MCSLDNAVHGCKIITVVLPPALVSQARHFGQNRRRLLKVNFFHERKLHGRSCGDVFQTLSLLRVAQSASVSVQVMSPTIGLNAWLQEAFPPGQARTTRGVQGVRPLGSGPSHLCKHSIQPFQRGPAKEPDVDPLLSLSVLMLGAGVGVRQKARR